MKEIRTVGIVGMGTVGISIAYILQQAGLDVIGFRPKSRRGQRYRELMRNGNIRIVNKIDDNILCESGSLDIKISFSLHEVADKADLILNCCLFPQNLEIYQFSELERSIIRQKNTPVLMFPGGLGSTWLIGQGNINAGLVGYSPVFAKKEITDSIDQLTINLLSFKSRIPLAYDDPAVRLHLLNFLNEHFKFRNETPTFVDGGSPIQTALSSPIVAINASAICDNAGKLIYSKGKPVKTDIYALSEAYAQFFQQIFNEQLIVADCLGFSNLQTIKDWLRNRAQSIQSDNVTEMLAEIYKGKAVMISGQDRRLSESYYALLFLKYFANVLGCSVPTTEEMLNKIRSLQKAINKNHFPHHIALSIRQSAISYAKYILEKRKLKGNKMADRSFV